MISEDGDENVGDGFGNHEGANGWDGVCVEDDGEVEGEREQNADGDVAEKSIFGFECTDKI